MESLKHRPSLRNVRWVVTLGTMLLFVLCLLLGGRALPRAGRATVRCYDSLEGGFCGLQTTRAFYIADDLPTGLQYPGAAVFFLGVPTGCQTIYAHGEEIRLLFIVRLPNSR